MNSKEFKEWKIQFEKVYPCDFATFNDKILYEIYSVGKKKEKIMNDIRIIIEKRIENFTATKKVFDDDNNERTSKIYEGKIELLQSILDECDGKTEHTTT